MNKSVKFSKCPTHNNEDSRQHQNYKNILAVQQVSLWKLLLCLLEAQDAYRAKEAFGVTVLQVLRPKFRFCER